jgi:L-fuculose-phosphate aldolase
MTSPNRKEIREIIQQALSKCLPTGNDSNGGQDAARELFSCARVQAIKDEIVQVGKKLWLREYVDGNGGNISCRISDNYVLCSPTMRSKGDLTTDCLCLVDFNNQKIFGEYSQTSEILLHFEIYKAVPEARAVIHCHPPHATAYAITGMIPQGEIIPEQEVFVGPVAVAPYDTPGTKAFAETILPYARNHNTILLENHGIVCWADTVTHAEWYVEVVDTYCRTLLLAAQIGAPIKRIPREKIGGLLDIKRKLGLPDARFDKLENGNRADSGASSPAKSTVIPQTRPADATPMNGNEARAFAELVDKITDEVVRFGTDHKK